MYLKYDLVNFANFLAYLMIFQRVERAEGKPRNFKNHQICDRMQIYFENYEEKPDSTCLKPIFQLIRILKNPILGT